jgi:soluble lytic murein transglycosylase-like protein
VTTAAGLRRLVGARIVPWARARMPSWPGWAGAYRHRLAAGVAMSAVAVAALVLLRLGVPHPGTGSTPARAMVATQASAMHAASLPATSAPVPSIAAAAPASASTVSSAVRSVPAEAGRRLLSDVSTMDLMMPIEEPDLDITSRQSLWSQIGKASGVDPLLLYSIALVESKALYPDGKVAPTPWLFRVDDHLVRGERHDVQLAMAAASQFGSAVQDVGIMQVYYPMHRDAVRDPLTLLNPRTNITVAAKILRDGMRQTRDRVLGVGYYHSHTATLARDYGTAVLTVYQRLKAIHRPAHRGQAVAR